MAATEKNKQTKVKWTGLGLWNVFFIGEFLLGGFGYLSLNLLQNVLLLVFVLFPIGNRYLRWFRTLVPWSVQPHWFTPKAGCRGWTAFEATSITLRRWKAAISSTQL